MRYFSHAFICHIDTRAYALFMLLLFAFYFCFMRIFLPLSICPPLLRCCCHRGCLELFVAYEHILRHIRAAAYICRAFYWEKSQKHANQTTHKCLPPPQRNNNTSFTNICYIFRYFCCFYAWAEHVAFSYMFFVVILLILDILILLDRIGFAFWEPCWRYDAFSFSSVT